jgi:L-asparaginase/Glu-tRNA(Gln) amidotransferase subunit D
MNDEIWLKLPKRINQELNSPDTDGVLITRGTDTLEAIDLPCNPTRPHAQLRR